MSVVVGLSGLARAGKTSAASYLEETYGIRRKHIATTLRAMLAAMLRDLHYDPVAIHDILEGSRKDGWIIPEIGKTSRDLQITLGTEWGRDLVHPDLWVKTWKTGIGPGDRVMNDSVRFPNEEKAIQEMGGFTILIERSGTTPAKFIDEKGELAFKMFESWTGVHPSERIDLLDPTYRIRNDGDFDDLYAELDRIMIERGIAPFPAMEAA